MSTSTSHAIVIGGSMAGLLTARVLSDHFARVTILERDALPPSGAYRPGAPQAKHLHALLARGQQIMERYFPGLTAEMTASASPTLRIGLDTAAHSAAGWSPEVDTGVRVNGMGRATLEWLVRRRVQALPNVTFRTEVDVTMLAASPDQRTITGVIYQTRRERGAAPVTLAADLVVDASGRRSRAPAWLEALGYEAPATTIINAHCGYATRWYELPADALPAKKLIAIQTQPAQKLYRGGGYLLTEGHKLVVTLLGANGDYPPTDEAGFMAYMHSLAAPEIVEVVQRAMPITPIVAYRGLQNQMRHYEKLARRPEHFIVIGDAAIAFNPIYGQGMSSAAMQAELLDTLLRQPGAQDFTGLAARFQTALVRITRGAWQMSTSEDMRYPAVEGQQPGRIERLLHRYTDWTLLASAQDAVVLQAFIEVMNLLKTPTTFLRPTIVARVLWQTFRRQWHKPARQPASHTALAAQ